MGAEDGMIVPTYFTNFKKNDSERSEFQTQAELFNAFTPMIHHLASQVLNSEMDERFCPSLANFKSDQPKHNRSKSSAGWRNKKKQEVETSDNGNLVIFVVGGITYAEVQACYELMAKHNMNVYLGGTHLLTATNFVERGLPEMGNR